MVIETWFLLSVLVGIMIGIATIINTYLVNGNVKPEIMIVYKFSIAFIATMAFLFYLINKKEMKFEDLYSLDKKYIGLMIFGGILTVILIFSSIMALKNVPNGGYSVAIKSSTALLLSFLLSVAVFNRKNNHINVKTTVGIILVIIGSVLIKVYSNV